MSNGVGYVIDEALTFPSRINPEMVELGDLDADDIELLRRLIREHEEKTVSARARNILVHWEEFVPQFRKVVPKDAAATVEVIRTKYLEAGAAETVSILERRTA